MCADKVLLSGEISSITSKADSLRTELDDENSFVNGACIPAAKLDIWPEVTSSEKTLK